MCTTLHQEKVHTLVRYSCTPITSTVKLTGSNQRVEDRSNLKGV